MSQSLASTTPAVQPQSLKAVLKDSLLTDLISKARGSHPAVVLIVDPHTAKIFSSCARMYDLTDVGVTVLENVRLSREPLQLPAIYFIQPDMENIQALIADFPNNKPSRYTSAHLYFTEAVSKEVMSLLSANKTLLKHIKTFVELNVDWCADESLVYSLNSQNVLLPLPSETIELDLIARRLVSMFLTVKDLPYIRYDGASMICSQLASRVNDALNSLIAATKGWKPSDKRPRASLLILDRTIDLAEPLVHEYSLQAMVEDLFKVQGELCYLPSRKPASAPASPRNNADNPDADNPPLVLSEEDTFWVEYRHQHINDVITRVTNSYKEFKRDNPTLLRLHADNNTTASDGEPISTKELSAAAQALPSYKNLINKYDKILTLASECHRVYADRHLKEISSLEQTLATGIDEDGRTVTLNVMREQLMKLCNEPWLGNWEKLRLVLLYILAGGYGDANKKDILLQIPSALQGCVRSLETLLHRNNTTGAASQQARAARVAEYKAANESSQRINMRFVPALQAILSDTVNATLSDSAFPFIEAPPSEWSGSLKQSSSRPHREGTNWHGASVSDLDTKARHYVFVLGGVTATETKLAYDLSQTSRSNVYIGAETRLTPKKFALALSGMAREAFIRVMKEGATSETGIYEWGKDELDMESWEVAMNIDAR